MTNTRSRLLPSPFSTVSNRVVGGLIAAFLWHSGDFVSPGTALGAGASTSSSKADTASAEAPDAGLIPYRTLMDESISLYEQKRYHKASTALFDYLEKPIPAILSAEARYRLGRSLEVINMPMMAMGMYRDITRFGPIVGKVYPDALNGWVTLALKYDDTVELYNRLQHLPAEKDPPNLPVLPYLRGLAKLDHGKAEAGIALLTGIAGSDTVIARQASYSAAMALIQAKKRPLAKKLLEPLLVGTPKGAQDVMTARELIISERIKELALLALARNAYAEGKYSEARGLYAKLGSKSVYQPRVQYELAWIAFFEDRGSEVMPRLAGLRLDRQLEAAASHPVSGGDAFVPEAELLAAMFYLRTHQHDLADGALRSYLERLHSLRLALRDLDRAYESDPNRIWLTRTLLNLKPEIPLEGESAEGDARDPSLEAVAQKAAPMVRAVVGELARHRDVSRSITRMEALRAEWAVWNKQLSWWKVSALGQYSARWLALEERKCLTLMGEVLQAGLLRQRMWLSEQNVMGLALRREVTVQRLAIARQLPDPDPYSGEPLPPFDFVRPE